MIIHRAANVIADALIFNGPEALIYQMANGISHVPTDGNIAKNHYDPNEEFLTYPAARLQKTNRLEENGSRSNSSCTRTANPSMDFRKSVLPRAR